MINGVQGGADGKAHLIFRTPPSTPKMQNLSVAGPIEKERIWEGRAKHAENQLSIININFSVTSLFERTSVDRSGNESQFSRV